MSNTVFFSWQADTATREGRNFIERALDVAIDRIGADTTLEEADRELEVDRDTKDTPGSPAIVETIFAKIDRASVFVADLTFVARRRDGRSSPNPNVLMEYGWALKSRGLRRIISVVNTAYGVANAESLPFNLRHIRFPIPYHCPENASDDVRKSAREQLARSLHAALSTVLKQEGAAVTSSDEKKYLPKGAVEGLARFRRSSDAVGKTFDTLGFPKSKPIYLQEGPAIWLRLTPQFDPRREWLFSEIDEITNAQQGGEFLMPLSTRALSYDYVRSEDGLGSFAIDRAEREKTSSVSFVFLTGEVWGVDAQLLGLASEGGRIIPDVREMLSTTLVAYAKLLRKLGVPPPYVWHAGMEDLRDRSIVVPQRHAGSIVSPPAQGSCITDLVHASGTHNPGDFALMSLRPFFIKLFDKCGLRLPETFDETMK
jgi:hypothetical protein